MSPRHIIPLFFFRSAQTGERHTACRCKSGCKKRQHAKQDNSRTHGHGPMWAVTPSKKKKKKKKKKENKERRRRRIRGEEGEERGGGEGGGEGVE